MKRTASSINTSARNVRRTLPGTGAGEQAGGRSTLSLEQTTALSKEANPNSSTGAGRFAFARYYFLREVLAAGQTTAPAQGADPEPRDGRKTDLAAAPVSIPGAHTSSEPALASRGSEAKVETLQMQQDFPPASDADAPLDELSVQLQMAEQGDAQAQFELGCSYAGGRGVDADPKKAAEWFEKAALSGHALAQHNLANRYVKGNGVPEDRQKAFEWYLKAAEAGAVKAQVELARCYAKGRGTAPNPAKAFEWNKKAAAQGHRSAQFKVAWSYDKGEGTAPDDKKAVKWYRKAAEQGHREAQFNLALFYAFGEGVEQDERKAVRWYAASAKQGLVQAQVNLAACYRSGVGVAADEAKAREWYEKAAAQGDEIARSALDE